MVGRMTSWTLNVALAAMAASAVFLPPPAEIKRAIEFGNSVPEVSIVLRTDVEASRAKVIAKDRAAATAFEITNPQSISCLTQFQDEPRIGIDRCSEQLAQIVLSYDSMAKRRVNQGSLTYADPRIEEIRMALTNLCRAKWSEARGVNLDQDWSNCHAISVGVAY